MKEKIKEKWMDFSFLLQFSLDDLKGKYAGSLLGGFWAVLQPLSTILIYWFVFQLGFHSQPVLGVPFILWLISGLIPWFFVSEAIASSTSSLMEYSYLVKKVLFNIDILPRVKVISNYCVQILLILTTMGIFVLFGYRPGILWLQVFYFSLYLMILVQGIAFLTSSLYVFFKDTIQMVGILTQFLFWMTPIVWDIKFMPEWIQMLLQLNPFYYAIRGYRNCLIGQETMVGISTAKKIYYWCFAIVLYAGGKKLFNRLKAHFADVM